MGAARWPSHPAAYLPPMCLRASAGGPGQEAHRRARDGGGARGVPVVAAVGPGAAAPSAGHRRCSRDTAPEPGAELAPRREEQAGSEVGGRCTPQNALADCSSSQLAPWQRRCARAVRCFTLCAGNFPSRAPLSALATNAATQPLLVALCGGAAGFDRR